MALILAFTSFSFVQHEGKTLCRIEGTARVSREIMVTIGGIAANIVAVEQICAVENSAWDLRRTLTVDVAPPGPSNQSQKPTMELNHQEKSETERTFCAREH